MGATEIIERFGLEEYEAKRVERYAGYATQSVRWAADWRARAQMHLEDGDIELADSCRRYAAERMAEAHSWGHSIRDIIAKALRVEAVIEKPESAARAWRFLNVSCADETCGDCERPLWQHIQSKLGERLCPLGRRYWRLARAIDAQFFADDPSAQGAIIEQIARRP